jgi:hypothetical protein
LSRTRSGTHCGEHDHPGPHRRGQIGGHRGLGAPVGAEHDLDDGALEPALAGIVEMIGPLPQHRDVHGEDLFPTVHVDRGYDSGKTRDLLHILGFEGEIAAKGVPAPIQAGRRWPVERTHTRG